MEVLKENPVDSCFELDNDAVAELGKEIVAELEKSSSKITTPPFHELVTKGDLEGVQTAISSAAKASDLVNAKISGNGKMFLANESTSLHYAAAFGRSEIIRVLIGAGGAKVNKRNQKGETPLMLCKNRECAEILLDAGADVNALTFEEDHRTSKTALFYAVQKDNSELVELLLQRKALPNIVFEEFKDKGGRYVSHTPLSFAVKNLLSIRTIRLLLEYGSKDFVIPERTRNVDSTWKKIRLNKTSTILYDLVKRVSRFEETTTSRRVRAETICELLLEYGFDPNSTVTVREFEPASVWNGFKGHMVTRDPVSVLQVADKIKEHSFAKMLIKKGASLSGFVARSTYVKKKQAQRKRDEVVKIEFHSSSCKLCGQKRPRE